MQSLDLLAGTLKDTIVHLANALGKHGFHRRFAKLGTAQDLPFIPVDEVTEGGVYRDVLPLLVLDEYRVRDEFEYRQQKITEMRDLRL